MRLGWSHLNEHKLEHGFNDTTNPIWICGGHIESINHFFLHCPDYCEASQNLFDKIQSIDKMLLSQSESSLTTPMLMHSFSTQQLDSYYFQEDSMNRYLLELKMLFFFLSLINFSNGFLFAFVYLFCFCYLLFVLISQAFVMFYIWFCWLLLLLWPIFYFLSFLVISICRCVICWNRKKKSV